MSRLRSQINSISLDGAEPELAQSNERHAQSPQLAYAPPKAPSQPQQRVHQQAVPAQSNLKNIQSSLDAIANKVNNLKQSKPQEMAKAQSLEDKSIQLESELQRISNGIDSLQNGSGVHSDYLNQMHTELQNLKASLAKVSNKPTPSIDMPGITRSIEDGYSDIANRLDQVLQHSANTTAPQNYDQQFNVLNTRIEDISSAVSQISNSSESFADVDAFHRLEARVLNVSNTVEQLLHMESSKAPAEPMQLSPAAFEPIAQQIERLSQKVDNIPSMGDVGNNIVSDFEGVMQRLDTLQADFNMLTTHLAETEEASNTNDAANAIVHIEERIGELAHKIDHLSQVSANAESASQNAVQIANAESAEILPVLRDLVFKVDQIQNTPVQPAIVDMSSFETQLASIASQLGTVSNNANTDMQPINDRLDNIESQIAASRDIVIDMANEAAQKTAIANNGLSNDGASQSAQMDNGQLDDITHALSSIAQRLSSIEENSYNPQHQPVASSFVETNTNSFVETGRSELAQEVNEQVSARAYESAGLGAFDANDNVNEDNTINVSDSISENGEGSPLLQGNEATSNDEIANDVNYGEVSDAPSMDTNFSQTDELGSQNSAPVEDVPLEPGSGMPDIEALVRRATQRKKDENSQSGEKRSDASSDLVAAARRAAQAASLEAQANNGAADAKSDKKSKLSRLLKRNKKASVKTAKVAEVSENVDGEIAPESEAKAQGSGKPKQLMMASVAAIALGFVAYTVVPKFLNASSTPAAIETSALSTQSTNNTQVDASLPMVESNVEAPTKLAAREMMSPQSTANAGDTGFDQTVENLNAPNVIVKDKIENELPSTASIESELPVKSVPTQKIVTGPVPSSEVGNKALIQAASNGDLNAIFEVGHRYSDGIGVKRSFENAAKWYELAASKGHALSQYRIGNFYEKGHGVKADPEKAAIWYEQSAKQGNALAMHNLAVLNAQGVIGTEPNMVRAVELFEKAADLGVKDSQVNLGIMYTQGMGADKNLEAAYKWFAIANRAGDQDAGKKRDIVGNAMRPEQLKIARAKAESWKPQQIVMASNTATANPAWTNGGNTEKISKKDIIRKTQSLLTRAGFDPGPADGLFGLKTRDAIISFQKRAGLKANGEISPELLQALSKVST